ncbi:MAG: ArnT family glycosyltransferase [Chloroflexota bacterium]
MKRFLRNLWTDSANRLLLGLGLLKLVIHLLTSSTYGIFRDEFYYIAASKRLAFGYVDFPPFIALLTAFIRATLGESLLALHFFPALAGAALVALTGLMARQLGADRFGQGLAALAVLIAPQFLGVTALLTMDPFDTLMWSAAAYILILIFKTDRPKPWLAFGLAAGISLTMKVSFLYFGLAMVIGLLLTPHRKHFRSPWLYLGGLIALAFLLPYLLWNAAHGWPTLEFWRNYGEKVYQASPPVFLLQQVMIMQPITLPLWLAGLAWLFSKKGETYRPLAWIYVILLGIFMLQSAKNYFLAPAYPMLFAAGIVGVEQSVLAGRLGWIKSTTYAACLVMFGLLTAPMAIPMLPFQAHLAYMRLMGGLNTQSEKSETSIFPQGLADRFGWEEMAETMGEIYHALPPEDQAEACIFTENYGEAAALEFYREKYGLPPVISGHNNYYLWGPQDCTGEVLLFFSLGTPQELQPFFEQVEQAGVFTCQYCMPFESNSPILLARGMKMPIEQAWPTVKRFD